MRPDAEAVSEVSTTGKHIRWMAKRHAGVRWNPVKCKSDRPPNRDSCGTLPQNVLLDEHSDREIYPHKSDDPRYMCSFDGKYMILRILEVV